MLLLSTDALNQLNTFYDTKNGFFVCYTTISNNKLCKKNYSVKIVKMVSENLIFQVSVSSKIQ